MISLSTDDTSFLLYSRGAISARLRLGFYCISPYDKISWVPKPPRWLYKNPRPPSLCWAPHATFPGLAVNDGPKMPVCKQVCKIKPWHFKKLSFPSTFRSLRVGFQQCVPLGVIKANAWIFFRNLTENKQTEEQMLNSPQVKHHVSSVDRYWQSHNALLISFLFLKEKEVEKTRQNPQSLPRLNFLTLLWTDYTDFVD